MSTDSRIDASGRRHVFISFASDDLELANQVLEALERAGIPCWIAHRDIQPATSYPAAITAALAASGAVLLVLTESANHSPHVLREIEMAFNSRTPILLVRSGSILPSANLQYFLSTTQWFDAGAAFDQDDAARLQGRLKRLLEGERITGDRQQTRWRTRRVLAVTAAAAIAVAVGAWLLRGPGTRTPDGKLPSISASPKPDGSASGAPEASAPAPPVLPPKEPPSPAAVRMKTNPRDGQAYVWVPPGAFIMGCSGGDPDCNDDESPAHAVQIARGFWLGRTEVTEGQYRRRAPAGDVDRHEVDGTLPATRVTWDEARAYCAAVGGRLPTEAEWEYAARAGTTTRYYDAPTTVAWYQETSDDRLHPVATRKPNALGLHDMLGNAAEWVHDRYYNKYDDASGSGPVEEPTLPHASAVARGGSWTSEARNIRASRRAATPPDAAEPIIGFRCALDEL